MTVERLLRWYPEAWRQRYRDEYVLFLEDILDGQRPTVRFRISVAWAGLVERAHAAGLVGDSASPAQQTRTGTFVVLWAWVAFVLAGCALAKRAEHAGAGHRLAVVQTFAVLSILVVIAAGVVVAPSVARFIRAGGWSSIARHARRASAATLLAVVTSVSVILWARELPPRTLETGAWPYGAAFLGAGVTVAAALALWTGVVVALAKRVDLSSSLLATLGWLSVVVCAAMTATTVAAFAWSASARVGGPVGLGLIAAVLIGADISALYGAARVRAA